MKKSLIYSAIVASLIVAITGSAISTSGIEATESQTQIIAELKTENKVATKNETVYVITDGNGKTNRVFIGNTPDFSEADLPVELSISYFLDGAEIKTNELTGKSGHVKIIFTYPAKKSYQDKLIPFLNITGLTLDGAKFNNVKVKNGKIISESDNIMIAGYTTSGMNRNLNTDILPESFEIEADVNDFKMGTVYGISTNELFAEIDSSKLTSIDDLVSSMNELSNGLDKIITGAETLENGVLTLKNESEKLKSGAKQVSTGLSQLTAKNAELTGGAKQTFEALLNQTLAGLNSNTTLVDAVTLYGGNYSVSMPTELTIENYADVLTNLTNFVNNIGGDPSQLVATKTSLDQYNEFYTGLLAYTNNVSLLANGADQVSNGVNALIDGETKIYQGANELKNGLATFKTTGIDKLVDFANNNLAGFTNNLRATINAAKSYHAYKNSGAETVKFIFKISS